MAVNKRLAKKKAKMAAAKQATAEQKAVEIKIEETVQVEEVKIEEVVAETTPVVEEPAVKEEKAPEVVEEKKPAVKRTRKKAVKVSLVVQAGDKEVSMEDAIERVKEAWIAEGNKAADLKELAVYAKPEDQAIYYVVNGTITGKIAF